MITTKLTVKPFKNSNGSASWRVSGMMLGVRVRRNFRDKADALAEKRSLEIKAMRETTGLRAVGTFLTDAQLREAEALFVRLGNLHRLRVEEFEREQGRRQSWRAVSPAQHQPFSCPQPNTAYPQQVDGAYATQHPPQGYVNHGEFDSAQHQPQLSAVSAVLALSPSAQTTHATLLPAQPMHALLPAPLSPPSLPSLTAYFECGVKHYAEPVSRMLLSEAIDAYVAARKVDCGNAQIKPIHFGCIERHMKRVDAFFPGMLLADFSAERIYEFCQHVKPRGKAGVMPNDQHGKAVKKTANKSGGEPSSNPSSQLGDEQGGSSGGKRGKSGNEPNGNPGNKLDGDKPGSKHSPSGGKSRSGPCCNPGGKWSGKAGGEPGGQPKKPGVVTHNNRRNLISGFLTFVMEKEWLAKNPIGKVPRFKTEHLRGAAPALTDARAAELMAFVEGYEGGRFVPYYALCLFAGIRPDINDGEIFKMPISAIKPELGFIRITADVSKVKMPRDIVIQPNLAAWLAAFPPSEARPIIAPDLLKHRKIISKKFALSPDILRHTFISMLVTKTNSKDFVAMQAGNSVKIIDKHYYAIKLPREGGDSESLIWFQ